MFNKILIANRGEIAIRIMQTAKKLGIHTVAIFSSIDANAEHVKFADEAYCVGEAPSQQSYLNQQAIIDVAVKTKTQAIHPGYGFLAENAQFAKLCEKNNITFIGPSVANIEAMGSKQTAKLLLEKAKVPLVPGYHGDCQKPETLLKQARACGFPVLLKAALGGGGKGMRLVRAENEFAESVNSAKREALASFDDDTLLIEKYIENPRHVEIQVFADNHANAVYLFERDCSIQRRHQKIIEEAPAPLLSDNLRQRLGKAALAVVKAIDYIGAGTVEFLVSGEDFYFMEMNTRLQVEHPVTEEITHTDLVEWQLRVANDEVLPLNQQQLTVTGHAIEVRIYAEDPDNNFLPSIGKINQLDLPEAKSWLRIDSGVIAGDTISQFYDPMIAKLIVKADDRLTAIKRCCQALKDYRITGISTNINYLLKILQTQAFRQGQLSTHFLDEQTLTAVNEPPLPATVIAACYQLTQQQAQTDNQLQQESFAWQSLLNNEYEMLFETQNKTQTIIVNLERAGNQDGQASFELDGKNYFLTQLALEANSLSFLFDNQRINVEVLDDGEHIYCYFQGNQQSVSRVDKLQRYGTLAEKQGQLTAPMPGTVVAVMAKSGQQVVAGDNLIVIEAMKMEHTISAPIPGLIDSVYYQVGDQVNEGDELVSIEAEKDASK